MTNQSAKMATVQDFKLSRYGRASTVASPVNHMMAAFAGDFREGTDVNLGVGYVNEQTIPRELIQASLAHVTANPQIYRTPFNYGGPAGAGYLVDSIRRFFADRRIGGLTRELLETKQIVIGASGATSLLEALATVLGPGIVLTSDPNYYIYTDLLDRIGFEIVAVPEDDDGIDTDRLAQAIDALGERRQEVSFVYVVTVNNPTCSILSNARRGKLVRIVTQLGNRLGRKVPLLMDTAYELLVHDPDVPRPESALLHDESGIVYEIGTLSKILAPALRIGFMIGEASNLTEAVVQKVSDVGFSAPLVNQGIASHLLDHCVDQQLDEVKRGYRAKARRMQRWIDEHLGEHLSHCVGGSAGFYFYLTLNKIETHEQSPFFRFLSRTTGDHKMDGRPGGRRPRVIYVPGEYCVHPAGALVDVSRRQLRLSYGFEEIERIEQALRLMGQACRYAIEHGDNISMT